MAFSLERLSSISSSSSLTLCLCLPFLAFFSAGRNTTMQGIILIIAGGLAWLALGLSQQRWLVGLRRTDYALLGILILSGCLATITSPHLSYNLLGAPQVQLGLFGYIACIGCGLLARRYSGLQVIRFGYGAIVVLAVVSIPYGLIRFHSLIRNGGLLAQSDIFACLIGAGIILGMALFKYYPQQRYRLVISQCLLIIILLLTETRAAIILVITIVSLRAVWSVHIRPHTTKNYLLVGGCFGLLLLLIAILHNYAPSRLTNAGYFNTSISYRLHLQAAAIRASWQRPLFGYGPGNLADALACKGLHSSDLQQTCHDHYFFNSSHNIYLDRYLAVGWLGGTAYALFIIKKLVEQFRAGGLLNPIAGCLLLIFGYYLSNVTSVVLELFLWLLLLQIAYLPNKIPNSE